MIRPLDLNTNATCLTEMLAWLRHKASTMARQEGIKINVKYANRVHSGSVLFEKAILHLRHWNKDIASGGDSDPKSDEELSERDRTTLITVGKADLVPTTDFSFSDARFVQHR